MRKILVTGATGGLGGATLDFLLKQGSAPAIAALARDPAKLAGRAAAGVDVRQGDYADYNSLVRAFDGVDTLLLVSAVAFSDRATHEANAVRAAQTAGVGHVIYTSIQKRPGSTLTISQVTDTNDRTEQALADSGMRFTILRNSLYLDSLPLLLGQQAFTSAIRAPWAAGARHLPRAAIWPKGPPPFWPSPPPTPTRFTPWGAARLLPLPMSCPSSPRRWATRSHMRASPLKRTWPKPWPGACRSRLPSLPASG